jgi:hypothetical protein
MNLKPQLVKDIAADKITEKDQLIMSVTTVNNLSLCDNPKYSL